MQGLRALSLDKKGKRRVTALLGQEPCSVIVDCRCEGGSAVVAAELEAKLLAEGKPVLYLTYDRRKKRIEATLMREGERLSFLCRSLDALRKSGLFRIGGLHVNELVGWGVPRPEAWFLPRNGSGSCRLTGAVLRQTVRLKEEQGATLHFIVNDYFAVCPSVHLLDIHERYCGIPEDPAVCAACLPSLKRRRGLSLARWREDWQHFLDAADSVTLISENSLSLMRRVFRLRDEQVRIEPPSGARPFARQVTLPPGPMNVAVVGAIGVHKGARIVPELGKMLAEAMPGSRIVVVGNMDTLGLPVPDNVIVTGPYIRDDLPDILELHACTVGLLPSVIPETYSLVTRELMTLGLPLVCFPLGAPPDRVGPWEKGLVAREISAQAALDALLELDGRRAGRR